MDGHGCFFFAVMCKYVCICILIVTVSVGQGHFSRIEDPFKVILNGH